MASGSSDPCTWKPRTWQALQRLAGLGCRVEPAALDMEPSRIWEGWLVWRKLLVASRIAPFLLKADNRRHIKPEALWEHDQAQGVTGAQFMSASTTRTAFYLRMLALFEGYDYLALPVAQVWPFDVDARWPQQINGVPMDTYHRWMEVVIYATFAGLPCISVPAGFNADGLPMGLQLIGRPQATQGLLGKAALLPRKAGEREGMGQLTVRSLQAMRSALWRAVSPPNASARHSRSRGLRTPRASTSVRRSRGHRFNTDQASEAASARSWYSRGLNMKHSKARPAGKGNSTRTTLW